MPDRDVRTIRVELALLLRLFVKDLRERYENSTTDNTVDDVGWLGSPASTRGKRVFEKKKIRYCGKSQEESELVS